MDPTPAPQGQPPPVPANPGGQPSFMDRQFGGMSGCGQWFIIILFPFIGLVLGVIGLLAALGKVVIIGRGASCVTQGLPQGIHVRLVAPERARLQNVMAELEMREEEALEHMRQQDEDRERMVRDYYSKDINDPLLYDVVWNIGTVSISEIAQILVGMITRKLHTRKPAIIT